MKYWALQDVLVLVRGKVFEEMEAKKEQESTGTNMLAGHYTKMKKRKERLDIIRKKNFKVLKQVEVHAG